MNNMKKVSEFNKKVRSSKKMPDVNSGDIVKVSRKIKEGDKERVQVFEGIVISKKGGQSSSPTVTVRRVAHGTGTEITIPLFSPAIEKIEIVKRARTRKAKLYYLRKKGFKLSKLKTKELSQFIVEEKKPEKQEEVSDVETETKSVGANKNEFTEKEEK